MVLNYGIISKSYRDFSSILSQVTCSIAMRAVFLSN
jgi:hypothetical protein